MNFLFNKEIKDWDTWNCISSSVDLFKPIIEKIFQLAKIDINLEKNSISSFHHSTNAIFHVSTYIIKIYSPEEAGIITYQDILCERAALLKLNENGVNVPKIIYSGEVTDKYKFHFIIMDFISLPEVSDEIPSQTYENKKMFVNALVNVLKQLRGINFSNDNTIIARDLFKQAEENDRLDQLSPDLKRNIMERIIQYEHDPQLHKIFVHGDLNNHNILYADGSLALIDFGECQFAPECYEIPPIIIDLFKCDKVLTHLFIHQNNITHDEFLDKLVDGISLHDFGGDYIMKICNYAQKDVNTIQNLTELKETLFQLFFST